MTLHNNISVCKYQYILARPSLFRPRLPAADNIMQDQDISLCDEIHSFNPINTCLAPPTVILGASKEGKVRPRDRKPHLIGWSMRITLDVT